MEEVEIKRRTLENERRSIEDERRAIEDKRYIEEEKRRSIENRRRVDEKSNKFYDHNRRKEEDIRRKEEDQRRVKYDLIYLCENRSKKGRCSLTKYEGSTRCFLHMKKPCSIEKCENEVFLRAYKNGYRNCKEHRHLESN